MCCKKSSITAIAILIVFVGSCSSNHVQHVRNVSDSRQLGCDTISERIPKEFVIQKRNLPKQESGWSGGVFGKDRGGIRCPQFVTIPKGTILYRAVDDERATVRGGSWSIDPIRIASEEDRLRYRIRMAICAKWNALTRVLRCTLAVDVEAAIGPTESVTDGPLGCGHAKERYAETDALQVQLNTQSLNWAETFQETECQVHTDARLNTQLR